MVPTTRGFGSATLALAAAVSIALTACGSSTDVGQEEAGGIATLEDGSQGSDDAESSQDSGDELEAPENPEDAFALFNECMGVDGLDMGGVLVKPGLNDRGMVEIDLGEIEPSEADPQASPSSLEDLDLDEFDEANDRCSGHLDNVDFDFDLSPEQQSELDDAELAFAACMADLGVDIGDLASGAAGSIRVEGVSGEEDPQGGVVDLSDVDFDFEAFLEASDECDQVFDGLGLGSGSDSAN